MQGIAAAVDAPRLGLPQAQSFRPTRVVSTQAGVGACAGSRHDLQRLPSDTRTDVSLLRMHHGDFVIEPLPNLVFTRDSSIWIGPRVVICRWHCRHG